MYPVTLPPLEAFHHKLDVQIRFNDIDILGHVNNTRYFSLYDTGKAHYFKAVRGAGMNWKRVDTVIANVDCAFLQPIFFGDDVMVCTRCLSIREKSFEIEQALVRKTDGKVYSLCHTVMVCYNPDTQRTEPISAEWVEALCRHDHLDASVIKRSNS